MVAMFSGRTLHVLLLFVVLISIEFLPVYAQSQIQHGGTLRLVLGSTIDNFNEFLTNSNTGWYMGQMMYPQYGIPLTTGILHLGTSDYWSNAKGDTWYFRVRPGMTWSDGVPVNATDLEYAMRLAFSTFTWGSGGLAFVSGYLAGRVASSVHAVNSSVVEVDLNQPLGTLGDFAGGEATPSILPYHIYGPHNLINNQTPPGPNFGTVVGAGPYYVSNFTLGDSRIVLLRNPYGSPFGGDAKGIPYLDKIIINLVQSGSSMSLMLKGGEIDAAPVQPSDVAGLISDPRFKVTYAPTDDVWSILYPITNYPYNMSDFRKAMAYAINRTDLVQVAFAGYGVPGNEGFIFPSNAADVNPDVPQYNYNPAMAEQLLSGLGWVKHSDGFYYLANGTKFSPTLYAPAESQPQAAAGRRIVQFLQQVGIDANVEVLSQSTIGSLFNTGTNMVIGEENWGTPNAFLLSQYAFYRYLYSTANFNVQPVFWPTSVEGDYNQTLAQMNAEGSTAARNQLMRRLQSIIAENLPSLTLYYVDSVWVYNTQNFGGWPTPLSTLDWPGTQFNMTALASIYSLAAQTAQTTAPSAVNYTPYIIGGVILVIALLAVGMYARKKRA